MPTFEFQVQDSSGTVLTGVMDALSANEAVTQLGAKGYRVQHIAPNTSGQTTNTATPRRHRAISGPVASGNLSKSFLSSSATPVAPVANQPHVAKPSSSRWFCAVSEKETFLLFAQMSNLIRSGIGPAKMLSEIAARPQTRPDIASALDDVARQTAQGTPMSDAMECHPDYFAPGTIGSVRAGEQGGYLWEALHSVSEQMKEAGKLKKYTWWLGFVLWSNLAFLPLIMATKNGFDRLFATLDNGKNPLNELFRGLAEGLIGPWGIFAFVLIFGWLFANKYLREPKFRFWRHRLAATGPSVKKRSKAVCLEALTFHYDRCMHAGLSPQRSWVLAIGALPNSYISQKMMDESGFIGEATPLSQIVARSTVFPDEFKPYVETAELSGTTAQAMGSVMEYSIQERKSAETYMKVKIAVWIGLISFAVSALAYIVIFRLYFDSALTNILDM